MCFKDVVFDFKYFYLFCSVAVAVLKNSTNETFLQAWNDCKSTLLVGGTANILTFRKAILFGF